MVNMFLKMSQAPLVLGVKTAESHAVDWVVSPEK